MFLLSAVTRSTLTAGPSSISYLVTVGPRLNPVTCASTWNWSSTSDSAATTLSLARVRGLGAEPGLSRGVGGRVAGQGELRGAPQRGLRVGGLGDSRGQDAKVSVVRVSIGRTGVMMAG